MKQPSWLSSAVFYNIYPQAFYDTNDDGIGDLNGVREKLPYIRDMGFTAIWLNPFYESPFRDAGYDITDFYLNRSLCRFAIYHDSTCIACLICNRAALDQARNFQIFIQTHGSSSCHKKCRRTLLQAAAAKQIQLTGCPSGTCRA